LGGAQTPTLVANAAVDGITDVLTKLKQAAIGAQAGGDSANAEATQIQSLLTQIAGYEADATVNGVNLIAGAVVNDGPQLRSAPWQSVAATAVIAVQIEARIDRWGSSFSMFTLPGCAMGSA
jgi:flagellin-like hook-associated protein FlgL